MIGMERVFGGNVCDHGSVVDKALTRVALLLIRGYQHSLGYLFAGSCRYYPSCSRYTYEAIERYGAWKGGWMGARRIMRCHPFHKGGYDPVP